MPVAGSTDTPDTTLFGSETSETRNVSVWPFSSAGPLLMFVAQPLTVCGPEPVSTV